VGGREGGKEGGREAGIREKDNGLSFSTKHLDDVDMKTKILVYLFQAI
jgi:hypothetical protein